MLNLKENWFENLLTWCIAYKKTIETLMGQEWSCSKLSSM
jgi:hypothetical protein